jgi:integral membrane protein
MLKTSIGRLRAVGMLEGASFLVLLGIAMPLKYFAGMPEAVTAAGWAHGALFMLFCGFLLDAKQQANWSFRRTGAVLVAALLPFGPFVIDRRLRKEDQAALNSSRA